MRALELRADAGRGTGWRPGWVRRLGTGVAQAAGSVSEDLRTVFAPLFAPSTGWVRAPRDVAHDTPPPSEAADPRAQQHRPDRGRGEAEAGRHGQILALETVEHRDREQDDEEDQPGGTDQPTAGRLEPLDGVRSSLG